MSRPARAASASQAPAAREELYSYQVRREGRIIAQLRALGALDGTVVVETDVFPVNRQAGGEAISRPFEFPDADYARRFVDEALVALEYLNCVVVE